MQEALILELRRKNYKDENDVKSSIRKIAKQYPGFKLAAIAQSTYSEIGLSDFMGCYRGYCVAIEAKFGNRKPTPPQERFLALIAEAGGLALCINERNLEKLIECLNYVRDELPYAGSEKTAVFGDTFGLSHRLDTRTTFVRDKRQ